MEIIDLSMPIGPHFRWSPELRIKGDIAAGDQFRISHLATTCHGFTHVDAQAHFVAHAATIEATPLARVVGPARVIDLRDVTPNSEIDGRKLASRDPGGAEGEILILSAAWDMKRDNTTPEFWKEAPWLNRDAAEWLHTRKPTAVAFDFPQDFPIRLLLDGEDRAERPARDARRAAARRRDADRVSGQHCGAAASAHALVRGTAQNPERRRRARTRVRDRRTRPVGRATAQSMIDGVDMIAHAVARRCAGWRATARTSDG